jgi:hypothetical protein
MSSPTRQCPLCHETSRYCRADKACYDFAVVGPGGLIAALVFGRAVRVDAFDDAGETVWFSQGVFAWSPARRIISLVSSGKRASEAMKERGP